MGLSFEDLCGVVVLFMVLTTILDGTYYSIFAFIIPPTALFLLIPIRARFRRRIIRDFLSNKISRGRCYDPKRMVRPTRTKSP